MFFDCHWHPTECEEDQLGKKISGARERGVEKFIGVPLDTSSCTDLLDISGGFKSLHPTVGIHPRHALEATEKDLEKVSDLMSRPEVVAIGEIGVDLHFLGGDTKKEQLQVFRKLLDGAVEHDLPVILHCPRGEPLTFEEVRNAGAEEVIFHWYTGPLEVLRKILDIDGYYVSVTPAVIYSGKLQRVVDLAGLNKILIESDGPTEYRDIGEGEPSHVPLVAEKIGGIKNVDRDAVEEVTSRNARRVFRLR